MADRVRNDIHNLARNSQYAPRKRLDDIYGRISRTIRQAESMSPESSERTIGLWRVVQADLAAMREASLEAATELLGAAGRPSTNLLPQPVAIDLSAEEQLGVRIANQNGRLTLAAVHPRGPAGQAGLRRGDVLVQAGGREVQTDVDLATELERTAREGEATEIVVDRNGQTIYRRIALSSAPRHVNRSRGLDGNR
jgi:S1-C subfamily serine protease